MLRLPQGDLIDALVHTLADLQSKGEDGYAAGLFPAQRSHPYRSKAVEDDSVFPTAVTVYTLQQLQESLLPAHQQAIDGITRKAVATYPQYLNNEGHPMYNFWVNVPEERFFPNNTFMQRFRTFHLPEDIDTTAYCYLTKPHASRDVFWLKERLIQDANLTRRRIRNTRPAYRHLRAYSTWLAQANMPIDFDVCALSNLLLFVFGHDLPLNNHDRDAIAFIAAVVDNGDHLSHPFDVAPWYGNATVILYHIARLMASYDIPALKARRDRLVRDIHTLAARTTDFMEQILLSTSLMRLEEAPLPLRYPTDLISECHRFHFFTVSLITAIDSPITWWLARHPLFHIRYRCLAASLAWVLEHEVYRQGR